MGPSELLIILVIVMVLFGGSRLPGLAAGLGGAVNSFKKALRGDEPDPKTIEGRSVSSDVSGAPTPVPTASKTEPKA